MYKSAIILAAGQGTRIKSDLPKVLHKVCGKEMVNQVIDTIRLADVEDINVVVGKGSELVKQKTKGRKVSYSLQDLQLGTGHAVKCAEDFLKNKKGIVAVFCGDTPLIKESTVERLFKTHIESNNSITIVTSILDDATGYGRIVRDGENVLRIVEHKDCNSEELLIKEMNAGIYCFDIESLLMSLSKLDNNNSQGEYYLTDVIGIQKEEGKKVGAMVIDYEETIGVNSRVQLSEAEKILRRRINVNHMNNGITLIDPENTYIGMDVKIGKDTIIYPGNVIEGNTVIGERCIIYPKCRVNNTYIADDSTIEDVILVNGKVKEESIKGNVATLDEKRLSATIEIKKQSDELIKSFNLRY